MRVITACLTLATACVISIAWVWPSAFVADESKDEKLGHGYSRKGGHILFEGQRIDEAGRHDIDRFAKTVGYPLTLCKDVDAPSFVALSRDYSKDKNKVYYRWISPGRFWVVELSDADPGTFAVLDSDLAKDGKRVWRSDRAIEGADPATAKVIRPHWTWKDRNRVYYQSIVINGADPDTFRHLAQAFYRDAKRVYWSNEPLPEADPDSFKAFGDDIPYARDRNRVWSGKTILKGVDAKTFNHVHDHVYKDSKRVLCWHIRNRSIAGRRGQLRKGCQFGAWADCTLPGSLPTLRVRADFFRGLCPGSESRCNSRFKGSLAVAIRGTESGPRRHGVS